MCSLVGKCSFDSKISEGITIKGMESQTGGKHRRAVRTEIISKKMEIRSSELKSRVVLKVLYEKTDIPIRIQGINREEFGIEKGYLIGATVTILDDYIINDSCIVTAGKGCNR